MKKTNTTVEVCIGFFIILAGCFVVSCTNNVQELTVEKTHNPDVEMEMYIHSTIIDQIEYLQTDLHAEYLHPELIARLNLDALLRQKLSVSSRDVTDTIFSFDEIPLIKESKSYTCISQDGAWESSTEHLTPFETNVVFALSNNPPTEDSRIHKTVIKNGCIKIYNHANELMVEDTYPNVNLKTFLDTMKTYVQLNKSKSLNKFKDKTKMIRRLRQQLPESSLASWLSNGHVRLESVLEELPAKVNNNVRMSGVIKSRTELNEDMTKILKFELFQGDYLIQRQIYTYNGKSTLCNFYHDNLINENPETIESESLVLNSKGFPVLHHTKEYFQRNQIYYYFKD